jgi:type I restriction enzyme, S subunit
MSTLNGWTSKPLSGLLALTLDFRGRTPKKLNMEWGGGDIPALSANNVEMGRINFSKECYYGSDALYRKWMTRGDARVGDIVLTTEAPLGNVAQVPDGRRYILSQRTILLRADDAELSNDYLYHYLRSEVFQNLMRQQSSGTTATGIQRAKLETLPIKFPISQPEQLKIAEVLSTVERAIEQTEALIDKQQRIKTGLMQDLLTRGIDKNGNLRSKKTHKFKPSPLGLIPAEWESCELRKYLSYLSYGFTNPMPTVSEGPYMVTAANISNGLIQYDGCRRTTADAFNRLLTKKSRPEVGDILITKDGTLGRLAIVDRVPLCINQSVAVLRVKDGVNNAFLKLILESPKYQESIGADAGGSTIKHIYISKIDKMLISVPKDPIEQANITSRLLAQSNLLHQSESHLMKLGRLKTALMQDLLTGRRPVTPLLAEPMEATA